MTIVITGITNPRNLEPTGPFHIVTYDTNGTSEIDGGFDIDTKMRDLAEIENISITPSSDVNGALNRYTFVLKTRVTIIDGDVLQITFPSQITLPATIEELNILSVPRTVDDQKVSDVLKVEMSGQTVFITFIKVGSVSQTYTWTIENIKNPPSTIPSDTFINIIFVDKNGWGVQYLNIIAVPPPYVVNKKPGLIINENLIQRSDLPATKTTYEISF